MKLRDNFNMKANEVESILKKAATRLYPFSFALLCKEDQAQKMVLDTLFLLKKSTRFYKLLEQYDKEPSSNTRIEILVKIKLEAFRILYLMVQKNYTNRPYGEGIFSDTSIKYSAFFSLEYESRAILYLKYKEFLDHDDMEEIFNLSSSNLISKFVLAKNSLSEVISL